MTKIENKRTLREGGKNCVDRAVQGCRFPPWTVEEYRGISFRDANNFPVAYVISSRSRADAEDSA
jgi:hypothetical protein